MKYYIFDLHKHTTENFIIRYYCCFEGGHLLWLFSKQSKSFMCVDSSVSGFFQEIIAKGKYVLCEDNNNGTFFYLAKEATPELFLKESGIPLGSLLTSPNKKIRYWAKAYTKNK